MQRRWQTLILAPSSRKEALFHPHLLDNKPGDKHSTRVVTKALPGYDPQPTPVANERNPCIPPIRYGFRSFDRQWIIPDNRVINRPNPELWQSLSEHQVYLTAPEDRSPTTGPALTFTALIPDLHHYNGRGGRVFPLWRDAGTESPNLHAGLLELLTKRYRKQVKPEDLFAYIAAVATHPAFVARFESNLAQPGLRIPLTASGTRFFDAAELGRTIIWLHTFGERFTDPAKGRPAQPPRLPAGEAPHVPKGGAIPQEPGTMPDILAYDEATGRLSIGDGYVERVTPRMWNYEVSGKKVLRQWFSYRKSNRERPIIGDRRPPSKLGDIQPDHWLAEYTTELINVLNVIGRLVALEPAQAELLKRVCAGPMISAEELRVASPPARQAGPRPGSGHKSPEDEQPRLFH